MNFQTEHIVVCDFPHKDTDQGGHIYLESGYRQRITMDLPIMNLNELTVLDCDCSHKIFGLFAGSKVAGPGSEVAA